MKLKRHKVHLQAYCNNKMLIILIENKADAEYDTDNCNPVQDILELYNVLVKV